jgi:hypothetical protein
MPRRSAPLENEEAKRDFLRREAFVWRRVILAVLEFAIGYSYMHDQRDFCITSVLIR